MGSNPDPDQHNTGTAYEQLVAAGVDTMSITSRASDHYEWGYQPFPANFPSSRYGERVSLYYSLAWFDRYLKNDPDGGGRLLRGYFDETADVHSIGAGTYDPALAAANPTDPFAGNVPYTIEGKCTANLLSFYYRSAYYLEGGAVASSDMRALGCDDGDLDGLLDAATTVRTRERGPAGPRRGQRRRARRDRRRVPVRRRPGNGIVNGQDANAIKRHGPRRCAEPAVRRAPATATSRATGCATGRTPTR